MHSSFIAGSKHSVKRLLILLPWLTCISCIWWRSLAGSSPQSRCTLGSGGKALYQTGASPGVPRACHWGAQPLPLLLPRTVNTPSSEGWGWRRPIEPSEMEGAREGWRWWWWGGGGDVQQPKPLVISWLLHWDDRGTCITSTPPEHLPKKHKHTDKDSYKHPHPA